MLGSYGETIWRTVEWKSEIQSGKSFNRGCCTFAGTELTWPWGFFTLDIISGEIEGWTQTMNPSYSIACGVFCVIHDTAGLIQDRISLVLLQP